MRVRRSLGVAILLLCLAACGSRLNQENFDKIHEGMTQKQVRELLGEPVDAEGRSFLGFSSGEAVGRKRARIEMLLRLEYGYQIRSVTGFRTERRRVRKLGSAAVSSDIRIAFPSAVV